MYRVEILNELNGRKFKGQFKSKQEADAWIASCVARDSWGKKERQVLEQDLDESLRDRILSTEVIPAKGEAGSPALYDAEGNLVMEAVPASHDYEPEQTIHTVKADYVITETNLNLSKTFRNEQKDKLRKAEYPSLEQILHIILDHGLDSQEMADLQAERAAIKAKYPKEI